MLIKRGNPIFDKQDKYTLNFSGNTNFRFRPKLTSTTPINLSTLPLSEVSSKKLLIDFLARSDKTEK